MTALVIGAIWLTAAASVIGALVYIVKHAQRAPLPPGVEPDQPWPRA